MEILAHPLGRGGRRLALASGEGEDGKHGERRHGRRAGRRNPPGRAHLEGPTEDSARVRNVRNIFGRSCFKAILTSQRGTQNPGVTSRE